MIEAFLADTWNGRSVAIALHELEIEHSIRYVNLWAGTHRSPQFLRLNPTGRIPVIVDDGGTLNAPLTQTVTILMHLAELKGRLLPSSGEARSRVLEALMLQATDIGGSAAVAGMLRRELGEGDDALLSRIGNAIGARTVRYWQVVNDQLRDRPFLGGHLYSIADILAFPIASSRPSQPGGTKLEHLMAWRDRVSARPQVQLALTRLRALHDMETRVAPERAIGKASHADVVAAVLRQRASDIQCHVVGIEVLDGGDLMLSLVTARPVFDVMADVDELLRPFGVKARFRFGHPADAEPT